jgi:HSP20 family molecular chaperone IbpA
MTQVLVKQNQAPVKEGAEKRAETTEGLSWYVPRADIYEEKDALVVLLDMPGVDEKGVTIDLEGGVLSVTGKVSPEDFGERRLVRAEYERGHFRRSFSLSEEVDTKGIEARLRNGTLRIHLPKAEEVKPRQIPVKAG